MIKKRLIGLLSHAWKHIVYHILLQILSLIAQIVLVFTLANVLEDAVGGALDRNAVLIAIITFVVVYIIRVTCEELEDIIELVSKFTPIEGTGTQSIPRTKSGKTGKVNSKPKTKYEDDKIPF